VAAIGAAGFAIPEVSAEEATEALKGDGYRTVLLFRVKPHSGLNVTASAAHALQLSGLSGEYEEFRKNAGLYLVSRLPGELSTENDVWELRKYEHNDDFPRRVGFPRVNKGIA
jgi:hypothetical protein